MQEEDLSPYYLALAESRQGRLLRDTGPKQVIWFVVFLVLGITCAVGAQPIVAGVLWLFGIAGAWRFNRGVGYRLPGIWMRGGWIKHKGNRIGGTEEEPAAFQLRVHNFLNAIGSVDDAESNTDTVYLEVSGFQAANADPPDRFAAHQQLAEALKTAIAQTMFDIALGYIVGTRPFDPTQWSEHTTEQFLHPEVFAASEQLRLRHFLMSHKDWVEEIGKNGSVAVAQAQAANLEQVWSKIADDGTDFLRVIYLTVERPATWKAFAEHPERFTPQQLLTSPLGRVLMTLAEGLRSAGFREVKLYNPEEVERFVWRSWNTLTNREAVLAEEPVGFQPGKPWPQHTVELHSKYLRLDNTYHAVLLVKRPGRKRILPDGMDRFLRGNPRHVLTSTNVNTTSASLDRYFLRQRRTWHYVLFRDRGGLEEQQDRDVAQADRNAVDMLYLSGSKAVRFNHPIPISAGSPELLEETVERQEARLRQLGMRTLRVEGRYTLYNAFLAATLGIRTKPHR